ncbi:MAG: methyltransferase [Actinomycetota bacterium]
MADSGARSHYFDSDPDGPSAPGLVDLVLPDTTLRLATDRGVFARDRVDTGTKLLLLDGPPPEAGDANLLDLGAGYGPIACTLARRNPAATVWAVEVNARARRLCAANAERAGLTNVRVIAPDEAPADLALDRIWSNPPIRIGKGALHALLLRWLGLLIPGRGTAHLVVQRHLGADSLQQWLTAQGHPTTRRRSRQAFRLLDVAARTDGDHQHHHHDGDPEAAGA